MEPHACITSTKPDRVIRRQSPNPQPPCSHASTYAARRTHRGPAQRVVLPARLNQPAQLGRAALLGQRGQRQALAVHGDGDGHLHHVLSGPGLAARQAGPQQRTQGEHVLQVGGGHRQQAGGVSMGLVVAVAVSGWDWWWQWRCQDGIGGGSGGVRMGVRAGGRKDTDHSMRCMRVCMRVCACVCGCEWCRGMGWDRSFARPHTGGQAGRRRVEGQQDAGSSKQGRGSAGCSQQQAGRVREEGLQA